jgi:hypothetical protein
MWKLKVADGGDPHHHALLTSLSNFAGRLTWDYDPEAGSKAERDFVEKARKEFTNNRDHQQHSADVLCRSQFGGRQEIKRRKIASVSHSAI